MDKDSELLANMTLSCSIISKANVLFIIFTGKITLPILISAFPLQTLNAPPFSANRLTEIKLYFNEGTYSTFARRTWTLLSSAALVTKITSPSPVAFRPSPFAARTEPSQRAIEVKSSRDPVI